MKQCCICGKDLPNRYAVAGTCTADGCDAVFCARHWHGSNQRCRKHGYEEIKNSKRTSAASIKNEASPKKGFLGRRVKHRDMDEQTSDKNGKTPLSPTVKKAMKDTLAFVKKMGAGASGLLARLKN
ncbi:MAG: hypothetical protein AAF492_17390, partial [Verrucomicrobiota bacterium]